METSDSPYENQRFLVIRRFSGPPPYFISPTFLRLFDVFWELTTLSECQTDVGVGDGVQANESRLPLTAKAVGQQILGKKWLPHYWLSPSMLMRRLCRKRPTRRSSEENARSN
jgi:hypothetical protein